MPEDLQRAAEAACGQLLAFGDGRLPVDPGAMLRAIPGVEVMEWQQAARRLREGGLDPAGVLMDHYRVVSAMKIRAEKDGRPVTGVLLLPGSSPAERRFALAHELGHILLGHEAESVPVDREANCFASHLLLPRAAALAMLPAGRLTPGLVPLLAERFRVSPQVIRRADREGWAYPLAFRDDLTRLFGCGPEPQPLPRDQAASLFDLFRESP